MQQEMGIQPDAGPAFPSDTVSSSSMTNVGAQHRPRSSRSTAQRRQRPYNIPEGKSSTRKLRTIHEDSSLRTDAGVDGPSTADQRRFTGTLKQSPLTTPNVAPSTQLITSTIVPDLTSLIVRRSPHPISCGAYGDVYQCTYRGPEGDVEVAVKAMRPGCVDVKMFRRELGIWKRLRHSNILKFMGTASDFGPSEALVALWMTNGTLTSFLRQNNKTLRLHDRLLLLRDIAAGLNYLHTFSLAEDVHTDLNPVVHGDLTGTNVLIDSNRKAYLADFGLSGTYDKLAGMTYLAKMSCRPGAVRWTAPELLFGEESASAASDMYSFGSIMLQVLTGDIPWCDVSKDTIVLRKVMEGNIHPRPDDCFVTGQQWDFMTCCWSTTPVDRPPVEEAVQFVRSALCASTGPQTSSLSISIAASPSILMDYTSPSTSPLTPTSSISSDEQYQSIAGNDYLRGDTDARKTPIVEYPCSFGTKAPKAKGAVRVKLGCYTCRIRRKKCDEQPNADGSCQTCVRLRLQCLGFGAKRPEWLRASDKVVDLREKIKNFLAAQGMMHSGAGPRPNDQEPSILSLSADYTSSSTSPQGIDSPLDAREKYPAAYSSTYTNFDPSWTQSILPRPHTGDFSATHHTYFPDDDDNDLVIPSGYLLPQPVNNIHHNWVNLNMQQNALLQCYMHHVLRIQYLHADGSIDKLIWNLIHSSVAAREAACLLANLHCKSTQGAIGLNVPTDRDVYARIQSAPVIPVTEGEAFASLCMVSYFLLSGRQGRWQAFLDSACKFSIEVLQQKHHASDWALSLCSDSMRFIIKTSMWYDVLASVTLIRRPKFLDVLRSLYDPATAVNGQRPELSMMGVMGCENRIVLALAEIADLAYWKDECRRAGRFSVPELVRRGQSIEAILKTTSDPDHLHGFETGKSRRQRLTSDVFRASALVYLHSIVSGDHPQCPEIMSNIAETVNCLRRAEDVGMRDVVRSVVFSICICGCLTDDLQYREYFLRYLKEQQTETVGNCTWVAELMRKVWRSRERGEPVDWRVVMQPSQILLL